ncbi:MAG: hypothetical protein H6R17_3122 [Proteobacteria bacterium]|nr:hypothetical protein [Pseudomonadota bacterium]
MNNKTVMSVVLAMTLASSGLVFGQGNSGHDDRGGDRGRHEQSQRGGPPDRHDDRRPDPRDRRGPDRHDDRARYAHDSRGAGPNNSWHRGDRLPPEYRGHQYVVDDWRGYHLSAPPRGYHWVQNGGDYILVAIASGVILQLLINN